jgi:hypothetical protein
VPRGEAPGRGPRVGSARAVAAALGAAALLLGLVPPPARADDARALPLPRSIAILVRVGADVDEAPSAVVAAARRAVEQHTALTLADEDLWSEALEARVVAPCAGDARCYARRLRESGADVELLLVVTAERVDATSVVGLRLVDVGGEERGVQGAALPAGASVAAWVEGHVEAVFPAFLWDRVGRLSVEVEPAGAELRLGDRSCLAPCVFERLPPGQHTLRVAHPGHLPLGESVIVEPSGTTRRSLRLVPAPARTDWGAVALWGGVAAGVVAAVVVVAVVVAGPGPTVVCIGTAPGC